MNNRQPEDTAKAARAEEKRMKKRSFKMATAFAGVAAATMGLGPAALAATALPAGRGGSIKNQLCSANTTHWLHLYYPPGPNRHAPECFGNRGWTTAGANVWSACPGNNSVSLYFSNAVQNRQHLNPGQGPGWVNYIIGFSGPIKTSAHLTQVSIFRWTGTYTC
jgi:hypothetical protein